MSWYRATHCDHSLYGELIWTDPRCWEYKVYIHPGEDSGNGPHKHCSFIRSYLIHVTSWSLFFGSVNAELRWLKTYTLYWKSIWFVFVVFLVGSWWIQSTDLFNLKSKIITFVNADNACWLWDCCFIEKSFPNATIIDAPERKKWKCQRLTRCLTEPLQKWRIHLEEKK